jgi:flagellar biosynthesis protein FliQ
MIRTRRIPFIQSRAAWPLIVMTGIVMALGIALPFSPLASYLQLQALPLSYFPWLVAILAGYMVLTQMVKGFYAVGMGGSKNPGGAALTGPTPNVGRVRRSRHPAMAFLPNSTTCDLRRRIRLTTN